MLALDLFNTKYEQDLREGAVDDLEARRIDTLNDRMQDLLFRAREPAYKKNPAALASLKKQFQQVKAERDSYYKIREESHMYRGPHGRVDVDSKNGVTRVTRRDYDSNTRPDKETSWGAKYFPNKDLKGQGTGSAVKSGSSISSGQGSMRKYPRLDHDANDAPNYGVDETGIPGNVPVEKIPGKEDLLKGRGRTYYEGAEDYAGIYSPEAIALGKRFCEHYNITDDGDVQLAVEIIDSYLDEYKATGEPVDLKKIRSGVADAFRQVYRGMGPGPNFRKKFQETQKKNSEHSPLDQKLQRLKVQARRQFPRAHTDDEALVLKLLDKETQDDRLNRQTDARQDAELRKNFALDREQEDEIQDLQTQVGVKEADYKDEEDDWYDEEESALRSGDYVRDTMDGEYGEVFRMQGDPYERRVRILDRDGKGWYIEPSRLTRVDPQDPDVQRYFGKQRVRDMDEAVDEKGALKAAQEAAKFMIRNLDDRSALKDYSMRFWSPEKFYQGATMAMRGAGHDEIVRHITQDRPAQFEATGDDKFNAMMGKISKDPWTQLNSDPNWEYEIEELVDQHIEPWLLAMERSGMPITQDNKTLNPGWRKRYEQVSTQLAQKYLASKKFNPRDPDLVGKIRAAIDNHTDQSRNVAGQLSAYANDLPMQRYADAFDADGMTANMRDAMAGLAPRDDDDDDYAPRPEANPRRLDPGNMEEGVAEGWSDAMLARRTGGARTPYSVFIKGKKWKDFESDDHAEAVARKLRAKFRADGRDPSVITVAPTDYDRPVKEDQDSSGVERAILNRIMVAHTDLLMKFGPDKVMQAAEEVAYNVGDVDEIGTSDVSAYVAQVKQILGATP